MTTDKQALRGCIARAREQGCIAITLTLGQIEVLLDELEAAKKQNALPPLNDDLIAILGRPNFTCAHLAELLRKGGQDIRRKAECEQAAVIYWFLDLYLKYGDKWESIAKEDIQARAARLALDPVKESENDR